MKTLIIIVAIIGILLLFGRHRKRRKDIKWIPVLVTDWNYFMNLKRFRYRIDFDHIVLSSGEAKPLAGKDLYLISGNGLKDQTLIDGRKISLEDGDMIVVDPEVTEELKKICRAFLVNPKGMDSVCHESRLKTSDWITADDEIIGAVIAKIPASWIEKSRIK